MARRGQPKTTDLVSFIFGQAKKASGRRGGRPVPPTSLMIDGGGIENVIAADAQNALYGVVDNPGKNIGGAGEFAFKNLGMSPGMESLMLSADKNFQWKDKATGSTYFIDPKDGKLIHVDGPSNVFNGRNIREVDPYAALNAPDATKKNWREAAMDQLIENGKALPGSMGSAFKIWDAGRRIGGNPAGLATFVRKEWLYPKVMQANKKDQFLKMARENYRARGGTGSMTDFDAVMSKNFDELIDPSIRFVYDTGKYGQAMDKVLNAKGPDKFGKGGDKHLFINYRDSSGNIDRKQFSALKTGAEELAAADTVKQFFTNMGKGASPFGPSMMNDPWLALAYGQNVAWLKNLTHPDPNRSIAELFTQFILTNQGYAKLASNQWLLYMAHTRGPGSVYDNALQWAIKGRNNHIINKLTTPLTNLGKEIGRLIAEKISEQLARMGIRASAQALGSMAPVIGNIVAFALTELAFKLLDPVIKILKEFVRVITWVIFIGLGLAMCTMITFFNGLFPDMNLPGTDPNRPVLADADEEIPDSALLDATLIAEGASSNLSCPFGNAGAGCTQYLHNSYRGENEQAIDIGFGGGVKVYSPCDGTVEGFRIIYSGNACMGNGGLGLNIRCSNGNYMRVLHTIPVKGQTTWRVTKGRHIGTVAGGSAQTSTGLKCSTGSHAHVACRIGGRAVAADRCLKFTYKCPDYCGRL